MGHIVDCAAGRGRSTLLRQVASVRKRARNRTPRAAMSTAAGRRAVMELLKSCEHHEARWVRDQGGEPFYFGFLCDQLGLTRDLSWTWI